MDASRPQVKVGLPLPGTSQIDFRVLFWQEDVAAWVGSRLAWKSKAKGPAKQE